MYVCGTFVLSFPSQLGIELRPSALSAQSFLRTILLTRCFIIHRTQIICTYVCTHTRTQWCLLLVHLRAYGTTFSFMVGKVFQAQILCTRASSPYLILAWVRITVNGCSVNSRVLKSIYRLIPRGVSLDIHYQMSPSCQSHSCARTYTLGHSLFTSLSSLPTGNSETDFMAHCSSLKGHPLVG